MSNNKFAIFGDCVSQGIVDNREHTRAVGFINWISLNSRIKNDKKLINTAETLQISPYTLRNLKLDLEKNAIEYLLEEKADFLLIDPNDCRQQMVQLKGVQKDIAYTITLGGGNCITNLKIKKFLKKLMLIVYPWRNMKKLQS